MKNLIIKITLIFTFIFCFNSLFAQTKSKVNDTIPCIVVYVDTSLTYCYDEHKRLESYHYNGGSSIKWDLCYALMDDLGEYELYDIFNRCLIDTKPTIYVLEVYFITEK